MLWNLPFPWSENIKKRACRYLLQRYLGNFLEEKLTLDQLSVDLYNGTGTVSEVSLDCEALNELGDSQNWPLEIVDGYMQEITVTIPWSTLLKDDSVVQVNGLSLTVQPKVRSEQVPSMLESMWSSMSSSMQLAAECIQQENGPQDAQPVEGIELFAHAIDSILSRVKIRFVNTKIRIEHVPKNSDRGIALEIHINCIDYFDEAGSEPTPDVTDPEKPKTYIVSTYTNKKIVLEGISFYTDEFPSKMRTVARSLIMEKSSSSQAGIEKQIESDLNVQSTSSDIFFETRSSLNESETPKIDADESLHRSTTPKRDHTPDERPNLPDPILFAQITGRQELAIKIKHTEEAIGPKVDLQVTLGTLIVFLTPRQLHTLIELVDGINQPDMEDRSNIKHRTSSINMQCKPMRPADFQLIEAQILGNFSPESNRKTAFGMCGWTGQNYDGSEVESERFHPMSGAGNKMSDSFSSSVSSMNTSVTSSVNLITAQPGIKRNRKVPQIDGDPTAEVSRINIKMSSCSCILLHRDILLPLSLAGDCVLPASAKRLQETSTQFFAKLGFLSICGEKKQEFDIANDIFDKAADSSHLRLVTGGLILEGSEKSTAHGSLTSCEFGIDHLLLRECVYYRAGERVGNPEAFDLVKFDWKDDNDDENESMTSNAAAQPNVRITFKQTLKYQRIAGEKKLQHPTTDLCITCMPFYVDVDLTLLERITASLNGGSGAANTSAPSTAQNQFNFTLQCANLDGVIRFPIADLRPGVYHEARRVRTDYLLLKFADVLVSCQQAASARALPTTLTIRATTLDLHYYENENSEGTYIARASMDDSYDMLRGTLSALPTISLTFKPSQSCRGPFDPLSDDEACLEPMSNPMTMSMHILDNLRGSTQPSPFSSKKMLHQSITKHEDSPGGQIDELVVPGNEEEMAEFTNSSVERAAIHLDLNLPVLSLQLESKQIYEILYNHINSDLLLWEPQVVDPFEINPLAACAGPNIYPAFSVCAPGYDSDSASTSSEENLYFSTYDHKVRQQKMNAAKKEEKKDSHNFCFTLQVTKGLVTIYTPVRDSNKRVVPNQMGELVIQASKLSMCHVSGLNGHAKTAQLCLRAAKAALYHDAQQTVPVDKPTLRLHGTRLPAHLQETIYPSGSGVLLKEKVSAKDMLSLALRVDPQLDMPNYKKVCMAMGIDNATLRHRGAVGIAWLSQLLDVLDVIDYPVPGYQPSTVLTELHVHLANCAIDYRPLYLPIRCVLTLGNFSVSSNVLAESNTSCLRFVAQECGVFVTRVCGVKPCEPVPQDDGKRPDVMKDYVCVMDLGLFELSVRIADKASSSGPHIDLSASNNIVNIHSCWDSASAVCHLLTYVASDGDCQPPYDRSTRNTSFSSERASEPQLVGLENHPEDIRELSPSEIQQVNDLMAEAMKESPNTTLEEDEINSSTEKQGVELFYFPDESNPPKARPSAAANEEDSASVDSAELSVEAAPVEAAEEATPQSVHVARELGDPSAPARRPKKPARTKKHQTAETSNTDDEFCIIESQTSGVEDDLAEPTVHWFGNEPVSVVENYFTVPAARSDVLKAPKSFPLPTLRYTLCEMSIVWHLFGGNDFSTPGPVVPSTPKKVTINEGDSRHGSPTTANARVRRWYSGGRGPWPNDHRRREDVLLYRRNVEYEPYEASLAVTSAYRQTGVRWSAGSERVRQAAEHSLQKTSWRKKGGAQRDTRTCVQMCLNKVKFQHETYPSGGSHASRQTLAISKIEILDRLANSHINKFLSQYKMKDEPERTNAYMLVIKSVHLRPEPSQPAQECCLKVSLLPLRFNIDQDTLAFLVGFFSKLGSDDNSDEDSIGGLSSDSNSRHTTPTHRPPVMSVAREPTSNTSTPLDGNSLHEEPLLETYEAERLVSENLIQLEEDFQKLGVGQTPEVVPEPDTEAVDDSPIYFRRVVFSPEVPIRLDYVGKRVDLSAGPVAGLLMGLGQLNCSELRLKRLHHRHGLLGLERLVKWVLQEWLKDIKRHQLPGLLSGIGPMHSLLQIVSGIRDLIWLPLQQWRRDGRLVHGLKRGAASFTARTAVAALDITARILHVIQATAETAFDMLTPGPTLQLQDAYDRRERRRRRRHDPSRHPTDYKEGVQSAYNLVKEGIAETAATITIAARSESGVAMLRHLPGAAVTPLALAVAGAADVLGGVRASLAPDLNRDIADKWRPRTDHFDN